MSESKPQWTPGHVAGQYCTDGPCDKCDAMSDAAPELYAALERAIPFLPVYLQDFACAALAKARGEE